MNIYLRAAFLHRGNLAVLFAAAAIAGWSGRSDVFVPLMLALELLYLRAAMRSPRFREHVDVSVLPAPARARFERLVVRCGVLGVGADVRAIQLRLLVSAAALDRLLEGTREEELIAELERAEERLRGIGDEEGLRAAAAAGVEAAKLRVASFRQAHARRVRLEVELERLEWTLSSIYDPGAMPELERTLAELEVLAGRDPVVDLH